MPSPLRDAFSALFSRVFPRTLDVDVNLDAIPSGNHVYVDAVVRSSDGSYRITDLGAVPGRIKIGSRHFRVSQKNRQTLRRLADWDPIFDQQKGFVFNEKDVPEILNYLRSKASLKATPTARRIAVHDAPLEFVHEVQGSTNDVEIKATLTSPDSQVEVSDESQMRAFEGSKYVHVGNGFFGKPEASTYKVIGPRIGTVRLSGDQILSSSFMTSSEYKRTRRATCLQASRRSKL